MAWDTVSVGLGADTLQQLYDELIEFLPDAMEKNFGVQPLAEGAILPIVAPEELGDYDENTRQLVLKRYNYTGVFRLASHRQTGGPVMSHELDTMIVYLQPANGLLDISPRRISNYTRGVSDTLANMNDANALSRGWKTYVELIGYNGDLSAGLQGLNTVPFGTYEFSQSWLTATAEQILQELQLAISSHMQVFATSRLSKLCVNTVAWNLLKSKRQVSNGVSVWSAFLEANPQFTIQHVPQFDVTSGASIGYMLPEDPQAIALVIDETVELSAYNEKNHMIVEGRVYTAMVVCRDPGCGQRLVFK